MTERFDIEEAHHLLGIVEKSGDHSTELSHIRTAAMARLREINDELGEAHAAQRQADAEEQVAQAEPRETNLETIEETEPAEEGDE